MFSTVSKNVDKVSSSKDEEPGEIVASSLVSGGSSEEFEDESGESVVSADSYDKESVVSADSYDHACLKTIVFPPGRMGMKIGVDDGWITSVDSNGHAGRLGVKPGWRLLKLNEAEVSQEWEQITKDGEDSYTAVFYVHEQHAAEDAPAQEPTPPSTPMRRRKTRSMEASHDMAEFNESDQQQSSDGRNEPDQQQSSDERAKTKSDQQQSSHLRSESDQQHNSDERAKSKPVLLGQIKLVARMASRTLRGKSNTERKKLSTE
jgi:hypothetical protein